MEKDGNDSASATETKSSLSRLQAAFAQLHTTIESEAGQLKADITRLEGERERLEREVSELSLVRHDWGALIKLNVGGRTYTTSKTTLTRYTDSLLGRMFSGRHDLAKDDEGRIFIDRNGELFEHVLDFLREGPLAWVAPENDPTLVLRLEKEFDYFQLPPIVLSSDARHQSHHLHHLHNPQQQQLDSKPPTALYVVGGRNDAMRTTLAVVERYDPATNAWTNVGRLPAARNSATAVSHNGRVYIVGGLSSDNSSMCVFDSSSSSPSSSPSQPSSTSPTPTDDPDVVAGWRALENLSTVRNGLAGVVAGGQIYALGGHNNAIYLGSVERYDARGNRWERVAEMSTPRYALGAVVLDGHIYAIGGHNGQVPLASVEVYDPAADVWHTNLVPDMPTARYYLAATSLNGKIYVVGGYGQDSCHTVVECYDPKTNKWSTVAPLSEGKYALSAAAVGGRLYALGGFDDTTTFATVECYDPATNTWSRVADMPTAKYALASVAC